MSRHAAVDQAFGDAVYTFRLGLDQLKELERKVDRGIYEIADRLRLRTCQTIEIREVLRIGLIGGGTKPVDALALVRRYVDERPIEENRDLAYAVALAALLRVHSNEADETPSGEAEAAETNGSTSRHLRKRRPDRDP